MDKVNLSEQIEAFHRLALYKQTLARTRLPEFIGVGAGRCGTTSVYNALRVHPSVHLSPIKEVNYFGIRETKPSGAGITLEEYSTYFLGASENQIIGEISPAYLTNPASLRSIKKSAPQSKLIISLRSHLDRFVSQYKHHFPKHKYSSINRYISDARDWTKSNQLDRAFDDGWFTPQANLRQSLFSDGLEFIVKNFPPDNILVFRLEELTHNPTKVLSDLMSFLCIPVIELPVRKDNGSERPESTETIDDHNRLWLESMFDLDGIKIKDLGL